MTVSYWQRDLSAASQDTAAAAVVVAPRLYDVCILGAGITGASLAYWLRREAPQLRVCVVEARNIGAGASGRNAGMILAGLAEHYDAMIDKYGRTSAAEIWEATLAHARLLKQFIANANADVGYQQTGSWRVGLERNEQFNLERSYELLHEDNFACRYQKDDPLGRGFYGALGIDSDAALHPLKLVKALLASSQAEVFEQHKAFALKPMGDKVEVKTSRGDFQAARVIIALNAYAPLLLAKSLAGFVSAHRGQIFVTAPLKEKVLERPVYTHHGYVYFRQLADKRFLLGGWRHEFAATETGYDNEVTQGVQAALKNFLVRYFPEASDLAIEHAWAGTMGFSRDGLPVIGAIKQFDESGFGQSQITGNQLDLAPSAFAPDVVSSPGKMQSESELSNVISVSQATQLNFVIGFTGHGFGLAMEVARRAVSSLLRGKSSGVFDVKRFNLIV